MWTVYVLRSLKNGWFYIGMTSALAVRLLHHNRGYNRSTKGKGPFVLVHSERFGSRGEARVREKELKSTPGRMFLHRLLSVGQLPASGGDEARVSGTPCRSGGTGRRAGPACRQAGSKS